MPNICMDYLMKNDPTFAIKLLESILDVELYPWQVSFLLDGNPIRNICPCLIQGEEFAERNCSPFYEEDGNCRMRNRAVGKTFIYCVSLMLDYKAPPVTRYYLKGLSDYRTHAYTYEVFLPILKDIQDKLSRCGVKTREIAI